MFGLVLFAFVCLIIAAGVVLPLYPPEVGSASALVADPILPVAQPGATGCEDCAVPDLGGADCGSGCPCAQVLWAAAVSVEDALSLTVFVIVDPQPSRLPSGPEPPLPKLPAI
jgi:hypothetical protein